MRKCLKCSIALVLLSFMVLFCGCESEPMVEVENITRAYLTSVSAFNMDAMNSFLTEGTHEELGVHLSNILEAEDKSKIYKQAMESMLRSAAGTMKYNIHSLEMLDEQTAVVHTTISYAVAEQTAIDQHMQEQVDAYIVRHPAVLSRTPAEQEDIAVSVMADAYKSFIRAQDSVSQDVDVVLCKTEKGWKVINGDENESLELFLSKLFETY